MGISDIFILERSGLPFLARCYAGESCKSNPEHTLLTGFFAAISSFSSELDQEHLVSVEFDALKLIFHHFDNMIVVIGVESMSAEDFAINLSNAIKEKIRDPKYSRIILRWETLDEDIEFNSWLDHLMEKEAMGNFTSKMKKPKKQGVLSRLKSLLH